jgi:hypothetical protein
VSSGSALRALVTCFAAAAVQSLADRSSDVSCGAFKLRAIALTPLSSSEPSRNDRYVSAVCSHKQKV